MVAVGSWLVLRIVSGGRFRRKLLSRHFERVVNIWMAPVMDLYRY